MGGDGGGGGGGGTAGLAAGKHHVLSVETTVGWLTWQENSAAEVEIVVPLHLRRLGLACWVWALLLLLT